MPQDGDYTYNTVLGGVSVSGYTGTGGDITIPSTLGGQQVLVIGGSAFYNNQNITSVVIPEGVTLIDTDAFYNCLKLVSVSIPSTVTIINRGFVSCTSLTSFTAPDNLFTLNDSFGGCTSLNNVVLNDTLVNMVGYVFIGCTSLTHITIPSSVTILPSYAFSGCTSLTDVTLSEGLLTIEYGAFDSCSSLVTIHLPSTLTHIGTNAFSDCTSLTYINIPNNEISLNNTFVNCTSLVKMYIPSDAYLNGGAFTGCTNLKCLICDAFPMWRENFTGCDNLTDIILKGSVDEGYDGWANGTPATMRVHARIGSVYPVEGEKYYGATMGAPLIGDYTYDLNLTVNITYYVGSGGDITIPSTINDYPISGISQHAFSYDQNITSVVIPDIRFISAWAFKDCINLNAIIFNDITTIGSGVFNGCSSLTSITFLSRVAPTSVGSYWIDGTDPNILGHTYEVSNFPMFGEQFYGLTIGTYLIPTVPDAPTDITATFEVINIHLTWVAPLNDGFSNILYYNIYRSDTETGTYDLITGTMTTEYIDTNTVPIHNYWYKITAVNYMGEGSSSTPVLFSTPAKPPSVPQNVALTPTSLTVILTWVASADDGGAAVTTYNIYRSNTERGTYNKVASVISSILTYTDAVPVAGERYWYKMSATNSAGEGDKSVAQSITMSVSTSRNVSISLFNGNPLLKWDAPYSTPNIFEYEITEQTTNKTIVVSGVVHELIHVDTTPGETYRYEIVAKSAYGVSGVGVLSDPIVAGVDTTLLSLTNLVKNGSFDTGTEEWNFAGVGFSMAGESDATFYEGAALISGTAVYQPLITKVGHTLFGVTVGIKKSGANLAFGISNENDIIQETYSIRYRTDKNIYCNIKYPNVSVFLGTLTEGSIGTAVFDGVMIFDLTETYGHGAVMITDESAYMNMIRSVSGGYWEGSTPVIKE